MVSADYDLSQKYNVYTYIYIYVTGDPNDRTNFKNDQLENE